MMQALHSDRRGKLPGVRGWECYRKCPACGAEYGTETDYREATRMRLFSSIHYGICSCGWDMEKGCDKNRPDPAVKDSN